MAEFANLDAVTAASIRTYFDKDSTYDTIITQKMLGIKQYIKTYCRHDFLSTTRTAEKPMIKEYEKEFYLKYYPISSITSLTEDGTALTENTDYRVDYDTGKVEKISNIDSIANPDRNRLGYWTTEVNAISVTYVGGHALTDDVIMIYKELVGILAGLNTRTFVDNEGVQQTATLKNLPPWMNAILDSHRNGRLGHV